MVLLPLSKNIPTLSIWRAIFHGLSIRNYAIKWNYTMAWYGGLCKICCEPLSCMISLVLSVVNVPSVKNDVKLSRCAYIENLWQISESHFTKMHFTPMNFIHFVIMALSTYHFRIHTTQYFSGEGFTSTGNNFNPCHIFRGNCYFHASFAQSAHNVGSCVRIICYFLLSKGNPLLTPCSCSLSIPPLSFHS